MLSVSSYFSESNKFHKCSAFVFTVDLFSLSFAPTCWVQLLFLRERGRLFFIVGRLECFGALRHQSELHSIFVLQLGVWD